MLRARHWSGVLVKSPSLGRSGPEYPQNTIFKVFRANQIVGFCDYDNLHKEIYVRKRKTESISALAILTLSCIILKNDQVFKVCLKYVWRFFNIMHEKG